MRLRRKHQPGSGGFKGIARKKSDDSPGRGVRTGTRKLTGKTIPSKKKANRATRGLPGTPMGKCIAGDTGKNVGRCRCGGHNRKAA